MSILSNMLQIRYDELEKQITKLNLWEQSFGKKYEETNIEEFKRMETLTINASAHLQLLQDEIKLSLDFVEEAGM